MLFFAADQSSDRDLVAYNITNGTLWTLFNANSSSIRLTVDRLNQIIYWISYNGDSSLILRKTDYSGNTTVITSSFGKNGRPAITQIGDYFYVLDSTQSVIRKYDKATDAIVQNITVYDGATDIIGANGKIMNEINDKNNTKGNDAVYLSEYNGEVVVPFNDFAVVVTSFIMNW